MFPNICAFLPDCAPSLLIAIKAKAQTTPHHQTRNGSQRIMCSHQPRNGVMSQNRFVADKLDEMARLLEQQNTSRFRIRA